MGERRVEDLKDHRMSGFDTWGGRHRTGEMGSVWEGVESSV